MTYPGTSSDASTASTSGVETLTDFTAATANLGWYVQNDSVMGGLSQGSFMQDDGMVLFTGVTNTNGGGFSSIRTEPFELNLSNYDGIRLQVNGDGRRFSWQLQTNAIWRGNRISYWTDFETTTDEWITVDISFSQFKPRFRGMRLDGPELNRAQLISMGLYIYDKQDGPFKIQLSNVSAYSE